jgi:two-component system invasion response regulator UvrY
MIRVLIVDDHEIVRRGIKEVLADEFSGLKLGEAENSQSALELLTAGDWDIVLLDINLPGRNGLEILNEINRTWPRIKVLIISAYPEEEFAIRSFKLGASAYLNKSRASDELLAAVKKVLAGGKYVTASLAEKLADAVGAGSESSPHESLSRRELQVLCMIASGKTVKEAAAELALSEKTVGTYRTRISLKMGLGTNVELARYALQHRLVD